jgi:hypothetical protein
MADHPLFRKVGREKHSSFWHVRRERITDPESGERGSELSTPGQGSVRYSKNFTSRDKAQHEADAWNSGGDWRATVETGPAPKS